MARTAGEMAFQSFADRYQALNDAIEALDVNTYAAQRRLLQLMGQQENTFRELRANPAVSDNMQLLVMDSAVHALLMKKFRDNMRFLAHGAA